MINVIVKDGHVEVGRVTFEPFLDRGLSGRSWAEWEAAAIAVTLIDCGGNKAKAARILKIGERRIYRRVTEYGL